MRRVLGLVLLAVFAAVAGAQPPMELLQHTPFDVRSTGEGGDLGGGVLIAHHPPGLAYSLGSTDWCDLRSPITSCEEQNPRVDDRSNPAVWYVLAAWNASDRVWCGTEFGLGEYDPSSLSLVAHGVCPANTLTIPHGNWPGPNTGIAIARTESHWEGNYQPIYYFACYAYKSQILPLTANPATGFAGFAQCGGMTGGQYDAVCLGAMGLLTPGTVCCPPTVVAKVCCLDEACRLTLEKECLDLGGTWHPEWGICKAQTCRPRVPHACCVDEGCELVDRSVCSCLGGEWHPEWDSCSPDSCAGRGMSSPHLRHPPGLDRPTRRLK
jgi:hypothetical protein